MSSLEIRPATAADLPFITEIYAHEVRFGTATFVDASRQKTL